MNATPSTTPGGPGGSPTLSETEIDASCRVPLFVLFVGAAAWLVVSSLFGLVASIKFHSPGFLSDTAWLTYGRVHAVANNTFLYGFALPAGLGVALWIIARLGQTKVAQPWLIATGAKLWNLGVIVGALWILIGNSTGFDQMEMPLPAAVILFISYLIMALWTVLTLHDRRAHRLGPAQWFLFAALFWFPWIYLTSYWLLVAAPVRGVTQAVVDWWFSANLNLVWLGLVGLAAVFHLVPRLVNRSLHSEYLALFTFWTMILFASWTGIPPSAPVPAWMPALSTVATVLTTVTVLSVMVNVYHTVAGCAEAANPPPGKFLAFGVMAFVVSWTLNILQALPDIAPWTQFTWVKPAQSELNTYGFFAMTMFGAIYYIVPRVTGLEWPCQKSVRAHYWLAAAGVVLFVVPLVIGGIMQGIHWQDPRMEPVDVARATLPYLRVSTVGELLILFGQLLLAANLIRLSVRYCQAHFLPAYRHVTADLKPAEVDL